jgi:hypothetical protein
MANENPTIPSGALPPGADAKYVEQMLARTEHVDENVVKSVEEKERAATGIELPSDKKGDDATLIAGKFKSQEELVKAYEELQKSFTQSRQQATQPKKPEEGKPAVEEKKDDKSLDITPEQKAAQDAVEKAGLNFDDMAAEYAKNGSLSEDTFKALEKGGIPRPLVQDFIAGQEALRDSNRNEVMKIAGGEDDYKSLVSWAAENMSADEIAAYNRVVNGRDLGATKMAVAGLKARFEASGGIEPNLIGGEHGGGGGGYESAEQMKTDMRDPRYQKDPAFRAKVAQKLAVTPDALLR